MNQAEYIQKKEKLNDIIKGLTKQPLAIAYSGGVDSSLLLKLAAQFGVESGNRLIAITADTDLHPSCDLEHAEKQAIDLGAEHVVLSIQEFEHADIQENPIDRCYRCKRYILCSMLEVAKENGITQLIEGSNLDDTKVYRPGLRAVQELSIHSPLLEAEFTKEEVRAYAAELGIRSADRPSTPCLATRFPYGTHLTREKLQTVEKGEAFLRSLGFYNLRLRVHDDVARIEVDVEQIPLLLRHRADVIEYIKKLGYAYITMDLEGFESGSMDRRN